MGGGIEFGENSEEAVRREIKEELGVEIEELEFLATLENIFVFNGERGHEIVRVYVGRMTDPRYSGQAEMSAHEDNGETIKVVWKDIEDFNSQTPLYPDGLLELLN